MEAREFPGAFDVGTGRRIEHAQTAGGLEWPAMAGFPITVPIGLGAYCGPFIANLEFTAADALGARNCIRGPGRRGDARGIQRGCREKERSGGTEFISAELRETLRQRGM